MDQFRILHKLIHAFKQKEEYQAEQTGLSARELFVLEHLPAEPAMRFNEFAAAYHIKPSSLTGIVERLEKKGLLQRDRDTIDRKAVYLRCTAAGRQLVMQHSKDDEIFFAKLLSPLDDTEKQLFVQLVDRMTQGR